MELLAIIGAVIGVIAGLLALAEKIWGIFYRLKRQKKLFEKYYDQWKDSGYNAIPEHAEFRKIQRYIDENKLTEDQKAFALLCTLQHGDKRLNELIHENINSSTAMKYSIDFLSGRGVRVGWRAEYALSKFPQEKVQRILSMIGDVDSVPKELAESFERIQSGTVEQYLRTIAQNQDHVLRGKANQVLKQIQAGEISARIKEVLSDPSIEEEET